MPREPLLCDDGTEWRSHSATSCLVSRAGMRNAQRNDKGKARAAPDLRLADHGVLPRHSARQDRPGLGLAAKRLLWSAATARYGNRGGAGAEELPPFSRLRFA